MAESASTGSNGNGGTGNGSNGNGNNGNGNGSNGNGNGGTGTTGNGGSGPTGNGSGPTTGSDGNNGGKGPTGVSIGNLGVKGKGPNGESGTWAHVVAPDSNGNHTITPGPDGKHTVPVTFFADPPSSTGGTKTEPVKTEPVMTVDEVYGKGNQSIIENQGDYEATSNEKSNVETSTFGKQDEISVTPLSVTEDKGLVKNDAIQSVEGLDFQQKDKANQDVMEAKKSRDETEAEDNANGMRNQLKAVAEKDAEEDNNAFQVGDRDEDLTNAKAEVDRLANEKAKYEQEYEKNTEVLKSFEAKVTEMEQALKQEDADYQAKKANAEQLDAVGQKMQEFSDRYQEIANRKDNIFTAMGIQRDLGKLASEVTSFCEQVGVEPPVIAKNEPNAGRALETFQGWENDFIQENFNGLKDFSPNSINAYKAGIDEAHLAQYQQLMDVAGKLSGEAKALENRQTELQGLIATNEKKSIEAQTAYDNLVNETFVGEEAAAKAKAEETVTTETPSYKGVIDAAKNEINNSKDLTPEQKAEANTVLGNVEAAAETAEKAASDLAANPNDVNTIVTYKEANETLIEALKDAKGNKALKNTDFNRTFAESVVAAINKSTVTMPDGSTKSISEFMAETVTRSPELAKGLYEAKAEDYANKAKALEDAGEKGIRSFAYKALAAIKNKQAEMAMTWLGSKFTFADNQVRNQFIQLAKTNDRATYAAYNNILKDDTGKYSEADKAEASAAINQSNALMIASAALQASTGFITGKDDSPSDGVYGTTDPGKLTESQKARNNVTNVVKTILGLGVMPGANEAYQNMYYLAGAKVNESGLFSKDFDGDGFALCQEYGNNAAASMIAAVGELGAAVALTFNPVTSKLSINMAIDAVQTFLDGLYGVQKEVNKLMGLSNEILGYFGEAKSIVAESDNKEAIGTIDSAIKQIEDFQLKSDEVGNLDNWLEGSGSNTADNGKFNQALTYDEWLKLIEADPVMQEYAKSLNR